MIKTLTLRVSVALLLAQDFSRNWPKQLGNWPKQLEGGFVVARAIYITSAEGETGKSAVALGVLDLLIHSVERVGVFRPVARSTTHPDYVLEMLLEHDGVDLTYEECIGVTYEEVHSNADLALTKIVQKYGAIASRCDAVVIVGSDYTAVASPTELAFNARIAVHLGAPGRCVVRGADRRPP